MTGAGEVLIACVGDMFSGDDGFGVAVARALAARPLPAGVRVVDFGIRGHDLAYALLAPLAGVVLVDAARRGRAPGTLYVIDADTAASARPDFGPHAIDPSRVLGMVAALGGRVERLRVVGCEPAEIPDPDDVVAELSPPVAAAVEPAAELARLVAVELLATSGEAAHA